MKGKVALFTRDKTMIDIVDIATGEVQQQHKVQGILGDSASVQMNIAAMAVSAPKHGVHVMDIKSGKVLCKFVLPNGQDARVALSKDTLTLAVGTNSGFSC